MERGIALDAARDVGLEFDAVVAKGAGDGAVNGGAAVCAQDGGSALGRGGEVDGRVDLHGGRSEGTYMCVLGGVRVRTWAGFIGRVSFVDRGGGDCSVVCWVGDALKFPRHKFPAQSSVILSYRHVTSPVGECRRRLEESSFLHILHASLCL